MCRIPYVLQCSHNFMKNTQKPAKTAVLRARCDSRLKSDVWQVALLQRLDESDIVRIAVANYVQKIQSAGQPLG